MFSSDIALWLVMHPIKRYTLQYKLWRAPICGYRKWADYTWASICALPPTGSSHQTAKCSRYECNVSSWTYKLRLRGEFSSFDDLNISTFSSSNVLDSKPIGGRIHWKRRHVGVSFRSVPEVNQLLGQRKRINAHFKWGRKPSEHFSSATLQLPDFPSLGDKYESLIVESGYKVYMKLRIRNVSKEDFMEYKCLAKNSLGGSDGSITLYGLGFRVHYNGIHVIT